jgi:hypothetical protein
MTAMKVYVRAKSVVLVGKAWEIRQKLSEYSEKYTTIKEWADAINHSEIR